MILRLSITISEREAYTPTPSRVLQLQSERIKLVASISMYDFGAWVCWIFKLLIVSSDRTCFTIMPADSNVVPPFITNLLFLL